jgi:hypothetical protein
MGHEKTNGCDTAVTSQLMNASRNVVCLAEDRVSAFDGLKLLIKSLHLYSPSCPPIHLTCPVATNDFTIWLKDYPQVLLSTLRLEGAYGWNVKPHALLRLLDHGYERVMWIDSDIIATGDIMPLFSRAGGSRLLVAEEADFFGKPVARQLTEMWKLEHGRSLDWTVNSGVVVCSSVHRPLLVAWKRLLESEDYVAAQRTAWTERPVHMFGDQDVLTALLGSRDFSHVDVDVLRAGRDIVQYLLPGSYAMSDRLRNSVRGLPLLIHTQGSKPWQYAKTPSILGSRSKYIDALHCELSPYVAVAKYVAGVERMRFPWIDRHSVLGLLLYCVGFFNPSLVGLPLAALRLLVQKAKRLVVRGSSQRSSVTVGRR